MWLEIPIFTLIAIFPCFLIYHSLLPLPPPPGCNSDGLDIDEKIYNIWRKYFLHPCKVSQKPVVQ